MLIPNALMCFNEIPNVLMCFKCIDVLKPKEDAWFIKVSLDKIQHLSLKISTKLK